MKTTDFYYMLDNEDGRSGYYIVKKEFWEQHLHIDDCELLEAMDVLPRWTGGEGSKGFTQEAESYFEYREGEKRRFKKGLEILKSLGMQEVVWGQKEPLPLPEPPQDEWDYSKDDAKNLLKASMDMLAFSNHPDFGRPTLLINRITRFLERK